MSVPLTIGYLGKERYGLWMITLSTLACVSFFDVGIMPNLKNRLAEAFAKNDDILFKKYSSAGVLIAGIIVLIGLFFSLTLSSVDWVKIFEIKDITAQNEVSGLVKTVFLVGIGTVALSIVDSIYSARLQISKIQKYAIVASIVAFMLLILGIKLKFSLPFLAALSSSPLLLFKIILLIELYRSDKNFVIPNKISYVWILTKQIFPSSCSFSGIKIAELVLSMLPNLIIVKLLDLSNVTIFSVGSKLANIPLMLLSAVLPVFWPAFTIAWSRGEFAWLRNYLSKILLFSFILLSIYTVFIAIFGEMLIDIWTVSKVKVSTTLLMTLGCLVTIQCIVYWLSTFLHSVSDFRFEFYCHTLAAIILIVFGYIFTLLYGLVGLTIALLFSWIFGCLLPMSYRTFKKLQK